MSFGAGVVIPIEIGFPTLRTQTFNPNDNDRLLERSLDLIEEGREKKNYCSVNFDKQLIQ